MENHFASKRAFDIAIYKIAGDEADELFYTKHNCTYQDLKIGEYCFCEAMKVGLAESEDKRQKIYTRERKIKSTFSSTMYLLCSLFENLGSVAKLYEEIANEDTEIYSLDPKKYLFNGQEEGDYLFGQGIINEASINDKAYLMLYKLWCLFMYREFYKNLLTILGEVSLQTYRKKTNSYSKQIVQNSLICMMMKKYKHI